MPSTLTEPALPEAPGPIPAPGWGGIEAWQLPLAQLCDSALPTGAFSHSFGLETYVSDGVVHDESSFVTWLRVLLATQLTYAEGLGLRLAAEAIAADDWEGLKRLDALLVAQAVPAQVRRAGLTMGARMLTIARLALPAPEAGGTSGAASSALERYGTLVADGACRAHPAIVLAAAGYDLGAPAPAVAAAYLGSGVVSLTQNAVRAIPLGQNAGQRAIAAVRGDVERAVRRIGRLDALDLGAAAPGLEIAQMRHERQRARMFMS